MRLCMHTRKCACTQERDRPGHGSHYCSGILNLVIDGFCLEDDERAAFPLAFLFIFVHFRLY